MLYSCFNPTTGLYAYFETPEGIAVNSDLPTPRLPAVTGKIGVPAIEAGRPMPSGAKPVGQGWHARGIIVQCGGGGVSGLGLPTADEAWTWTKEGGWKWLVGGMVAIWVVRKVW